MTILTRPVVRAGPAAAGQIESNVGFSAGASQFLINGKIVDSVASNALTVAVKTSDDEDPSETNPVYVSFRSSGGYVVRSITAALSLVVPQLATIGASDGVPFRIWVIAIDDGGTVRLGLENCSSNLSISPLPAFGTVSTTVMNIGSVNSAVVYSSPAVTSKAYSIIGLMDWNSGLTAAGTWDARPTLVSLFALGMPTPDTVIQSLDNNIASIADTPTIPADNTMPESSEGFQIGTQSITLNSPVNHLFCEVILQCAFSTSGLCVAALFWDSETSARAGGWAYLTNNPGGLIVFSYQFKAGAASRTVVIRAGGTTAGTFSINQHGGSSFFNGTLRSRLRLTEIVG